MGESLRNSSWFRLCSSLEESLDSRLNKSLYYDLLDIFLSYTGITYEFNKLDRGLLTNELRDSFGENAAISFEDVGANLKESLTHSLKEALGG